MQLQQATSIIESLGAPPAGRYYLLAPKLLDPCGKMPLALEGCPCCGHRVTPRSTWRWMSVPMFFTSRAAVRQKAPIPGKTAVRQNTPILYPRWQAGECSFDAACRCDCPFSDRIIQTVLEAGAPYRAGLLWLPSSRYPEASVFEAAVAQLGGVAWPLRRLPAGIEIGRTLVVVAHRLAMIRADWTLGAAMVFAFKPTDIIYYPAADEPPENLRRADWRGIRILPADAPPTGAF